MIVLLLADTVVAYSSRSALTKLFLSTLKGRVKKTRHGLEPLARRWNWQSR